MSDLAIVCQQKAVVVDCVSTIATVLFVSSKLLLLLLLLLVVVGVVVSVVVSGVVTVVATVVAAVVGCNSAVC